ncbi:MAG: hypothetical protein K2M82_02600 [Lachnospiraceae bacterium]|nr:hypothetical protein [Lachnospiraceae bacterium]
MTVKLKFLCVISAISFLASLACFAGYAAELNGERVGDEDTPTVSVDPAPDVPVDPGYTDPVYSEPTYVDPVVSDPGYVEPDPGMSSDIGGDDPMVSVPGTDIGGTSEPIDIAEPSLSTDVDNSQVDIDGTTTSVSSDYTDYNQYNSYYQNPYNAVYDDNYVYVPSYTEPTESLVNNSSKIINRDELTADDWKRIMLDLNDGNVSGGNGNLTFNFIKENDEQGESSVEWMLYLGATLIFVSVAIVVFVVLTSSKKFRTRAVA